MTNQRTVNHDGYYTVHKVVASKVNYILSFTHLIELKTENQEIQGKIPNKTKQMCVRK